ncbi:hypothetical protein CBW16_01000 [Flavobacteriaceae bacterium JJC]|nr:hypothetical protein CBW16_01000 [Flavobacteriaceae bacterium JJC]
MNLKQKKILFLSASFFGYEKAIMKRLRELGAEVDFFNERPSDSLLSKGVIRVKSALYQKKINRYYHKILKLSEGKNYDYFLLIKGETVPCFFLEKFKDRNPSAIKIFYSYDAATEYPKFLKLYPYFDRNFTFEPADAKKYQLHFRPLFFLNEYLVSEGKDQPKNDIAFIGSAHTDRYLIGEKVREFCDKLNLKPFFYYYAPGKTAFVLKKIFDKNLKQFDMKKLSFKKLKHSEIAEIYKDSFSVLDINKPFQKGLTMRTFEALASGKKLLTTNSDIKYYPFYEPENIHILDRNQLNLQAGFFNTGFKRIDADVLDKMSLDSWLHCLFFESQDEYWGINDLRSN